ncbi:sporulation integral membrane protein YtvI [Bacillus sp. AK128]
MSSIFTKRFAIISIIIIISLLLIFFVLPISVPLIAAFVTALFLEPLVKSIFKRSKLSRNSAVIIVFLLFILFIGISSYFLITKVVGEGIQFAQNVPFYVNDINRVWYDLENRLQNVTEDMPQEVVIEITQQISDFLEGVKNSITDSVNIDNIRQIVTEIPNYLVSLLVYLIALFLFMMDLPRLKKGAFSHMTDRTAEKMQFMASRLSYVVFGFLKAQFLVSILIFFTCLIGLLLIVDPKVAIIMSIIIWIIDFIPIIRVHHHTWSMGIISSIKRTNGIRNKDSDLSSHSVNHKTYS